jgi:NADH-quinone oxidoreductase subunit N
MILLPPAVGRPYIPGWGDLAPFAAECWLVATIVTVLLTPFFARRRNLAAFGVAVLGLTVALLSLLWVGTGGGGRPLGGILIADSFAVLWKAMLLVFSIGVLFLWRAAASHDVPEGDAPEFFVLILGATLGMCLMASTVNLLMIVMSVELASLPSYVLAGFRKTRRHGAEASLKYVLFGAACSSVMVYGLSFLYGLYGTLDAGEIARRLAVDGVAASPALLTVALFGLIVGTGFKVGAVPFHFWCPDVFEGASVEVSAFLSVASKGAALVLLMRLMMTVADAFAYRHVQPLTALAWGVGILGAVTATAGNTAAYAAENVKRLLAWSSIAHAGYMLCAVSLLFDLNAKQTDAAGLNGPAQVLLFYLAVYLFMNLGAFAVVGLVGRATGGEGLADFGGLVKRSPVLAHSMLACLISLIGLPPFAGFVAKLNVMLALMGNGGGWWWLVGVIAVNSVISAFYYFRVLRAVYVEPATEPAFVAHPLGVALAATCGVALVLMLVLAGPVNELTRGYARLNGVGRRAVPQDPGMNPGAWQRAARVDGGSD